MSTGHKNPELVHELLQALSCETRRDILFALAERPLGVSQLVAQLQLDMPSVSNHLRLLREAELVQRSRNGRNCIYSLPGRVAITTSNEEIVLRIAARDGTWVAVGSCGPAGGP